jgi:hypothetical protein
MFWNAGFGPGWAATAETLKKHQALISPSEYRLFKQTMPDELSDLSQTRGQKYIKMAGHRRVELT